MRVRSRRAMPCVLGALVASAIVAPSVVAHPVHQVAPGESLWSVAAANGMSPGQLAAANGLTSESAVQIGQVLQIPPQGGAPAAVTGSDGSASTGAATEGDSSASPAAATGGGGSAGGYVVQPGDSLSAIAAQAGVSAAGLAAHNGRAVDGLLPIGTRLALPAAGSSSGASGAPAATPSSTASSSSSSTDSAPAASGSSVSGESVAQIAASHGVAGNLARAIAWQESGNNNAVVSSVGARGVMQVMPGTWSWISSNLTGETLDPASATDNVKAGSLYLRHLLQQTGGDADMAAAAYYQGLASVRSRGMYDDTKRYVENVRALRSRFGG